MVPKEAKESVVLTRSRLWNDHITMIVAVRADGKVRMPLKLIWRGKRAAGERVAEDKLAEVPDDVMWAQTGGAVSFFPCFVHCPFPFFCLLSAQKLLGSTDNTLTRG